MPLLLFYWHTGCSLNTADPLSDPTVGTSSGSGRGSPDTHQHSHNQIACFWTGRTWKDSGSTCYWTDKGQNGIKPRTLGLWGDCADGTNRISARWTRHLNSACALKMRWRLLTKLMAAWGWLNFGALRSPGLRKTERFVPSDICGREEQLLLWQLKSAIG